jgi:DNA-binding MarR family transcriptional regulator
MRWRAEVDRAVATFKLTHAQYSALASLHAMTEHGEPPTQRELADYTTLQPIYVSKLVRTLEADGYLTRQVDSRDSRAVRLTLTESGRETIVAAREVVRALDGKLTVPIGGPDGARTRELVATLRLLIDHHDTGER